MTTTTLDSSTCQQFDATPVSVQWRELPDQDESESSSRLFACAQIDGTIRLCKTTFSGVAPHIRPRISTLWSKSHKRSVRKVRFDERDGTKLYSISVNRALVEWDVETGKKTRCLKTAHEHPPYSLCAISAHATRGQNVATGDECGFVRTWDMRAGDPCVSNYLLVPAEEAERQDGVDNTLGEEVTDMCLSRLHSQLHLLATSGDATLTAIDLRSRKVLMRSEMMENELLSVTADSNGATFCGNSANVIEVFKHGSWGNIVSRMRPRHEKGSTIDCLKSVKSMPHILLSCSALDGNIRVHRTTPNKTIQAIGSHDEGVEELSVTDDGEWLLSCGLDDRIKIWAVGPVLRSIPVQYAKRAADEAGGRGGKKKAKDDFFDGLVASTSGKGEEGSDDGEGEEEESNEESDFDEEEDDTE